MHAPRVVFESLALRVLAASGDELAAHQAVLDDLDKAIRGTSVWRIEPAPQTDGSVANADAQTA